MPKVLMVCTANICRSPVGEAVLQDRLNRQSEDSWQVQSAGTWADYGSLPSYYSAELMAEQGLDISAHRSQPVTEPLLAEVDLILCMASGHVEGLKAEFPRQAHKIYLLTEMSGLRYSVHDPFGEPRPAYEQMVTEVTDLVDRGLPQIIALARQNERRRQEPPVTNLE